MHKSNSGVMVIDCPRFKLHTVTGHTSHLSSESAAWLSRLYYLITYEKFMNFCDLQTHSGLTDYPKHHTSSINFVTNFTASVHEIKWSSHPLGGWGFLLTQSAANSLSDPLLKICKQLILHFTTDNCYVIDSHKFFILILYARRPCDDHYDMGMMRF